MEMEVKNPDVIPAVEQLVQKLRRHAKKDRFGVFWESTPPNALNRNVLATSVATGTPGILLFLKEYIQITGDNSHNEVVDEGLKWCLRAIKGGPFLPGFYVGSPGALYALSRIEQFCHGNTFQTDEALLQCIERAIAEHARYRASVGNGIAGALLALELTFQGRMSDPILGFRNRLCELLLEHLKICDTGVFWDRYPDSIAPNAGFLTGNGGIEFLLALYSDPGRPDGVRSLLQAAVAYDDSTFNHQLHCWPDLVNEQMFTDLNQLARLHKAVRWRNSSEFGRAGINASWDHGTAGILVAREAMRRAGFPEHVTKVRLASEIVHRQVKLPLRDDVCLSLDKGPLGCAFALAYALPDSRYLDLVQALRAKCITQLLGNAGSRNRGVGDVWRLGLLNGDSGSGYFLLRYATDRLSADSIVVPRFTKVDPPTFRDSDVAFTAARLLFPRTVAVVDADDFSFSGAVNGISISQSVKTHLADDKSAEVVFMHEFEKYKFAQTAPSNIYLFTVEAYRKELYAARFEDLGDEELLDLRTRITAECKLLKRPIDGARSQGVIWRLTTGGVREADLTDFQSTVFMHLRKYSKGCSLVRFLSPDSSFRDLSTLRSAVAECIRSGLKVGILEVDERPFYLRFATWLDKSRLNAKY